MSFSTLYIESFNMFNFSLKRSNLFQQLTEQFLPRNKLLVEFYLVDVMSPLNNNDAFIFNTFHPLVENI